MQKGEKKFKLERLEHESLEAVIDLLLVNENVSAFFLILSCNILQINWSISKVRQTDRKHLKVISVLVLD